MRSPPTSRWAPTTSSTPGRSYQAGARGDKPHFWFVVRAWSRSGQSRLLDEGRLEHFDNVRRKQEEESSSPPPANCELAAPSGISSRKTQWPISLIRSNTVHHGFSRPSASGHFHLLLSLSLREAATWRHTLKRGCKKIAVERPYSPRNKVDPGVGTKEAGRRFAYRFYWSNPSIKDILANLMAGKGAAWDVPRDVSAHYREQIAGEAKRRVVGRYGQSTWRWVEVGPNHLWDCECMQVVGALISGMLAYGAQRDSLLFRKTETTSATDP